MPGPNDLSATFTLIDDVSKNLKKIEDNTRKTTDSIEKSGDKTQRSFRASAIGLGVFVKGIDLLKKGIQQSELIQLAGDLVDVGGAIDKGIIAVGNYVGLWRDWTVDQAKRDASILSIGSAIDRLESDLQSFDKLASNSFFFGTVAQTSNLLGIVPSEEQVDRTIKQFAASAEKATRENIAKLKIQLSTLLNFGIPLSAPSIVTDILKEQANRINSAAEDAKAIERRIIIAAGNVPQALKDSGFSSVFREELEEIEKSLVSIEAIGRRTAQSLHSSFSDGFFDAFNKGFKGLDETAKAVFESIKQAAFRLLSDLIASQLLKFITNLATQVFGSIASSSGGNGGIDPFSRGGTIGGQGFETPSGVGFGSAGQTTSRFGNGLTGGIIGGGIAAATSPSPIVINIQATDANGVADFFHRNRRRVVEIIDDANRRRPTRGSRR